MTPESETILGGIEIGKLPKLLPFGRFWHTIFANKGGSAQKKTPAKKNENRPCNTQV